MYSYARHVSFTYAVSLAVVVTAALLLRLFVGSSVQAAEAAVRATTVTDAIPHKPMMRVGITNELPEVVLSSNKSATLKTTDAVVLGVVLAGEAVTVVPVAEGGYSVTSASGALGVLNVPGEVRFVPRSGGIVTVENYENRPGFNPTLNDNTFRGSVRVARGSDNTTWVVNVLPLGAYVRGVAESTNDQPTEYQRALATAIRTYAMYNILHPTKHAGEPFILTNTANDQVYKGYGFEQRAPLWAQAVVDTARQVLTYDGEVIVAPYFSHSDGRTRAWSEVWGGDQPWSMSVADPCCTDMTLYGHGVGMSGEGARYWAEQGWTYDTILKYYYSGVELSGF